MPGAQAPVALKTKSKQVCTCFNVSEETIQSELASTEDSADGRLAKLQSGLKCGTNCGSCRPGLRRLVQLTAPMVPA